METYSKEGLFAAGVFLSYLHIAIDSTFMSLYADLQPVYGGGCDEIWDCERRLAGAETHYALPSVGRKRVRSGAIGEFEIV